jgi:hypothetical protein
MDLEWIGDEFPPLMRLNIQFPEWKGRISLSHCFSLFSYYNVLQTFVEVL